LRRSIAYGYPLEHTPGFRGADARRRDCIIHLQMPGRRTIYIMKVDGARDVRTSDGSEQRRTIIHAAFEEY
jgi:hypothetical protein